MAFSRFNFTKLWTNAKDFPTVETDETQVRADMQALHDEAKTGLNALMDELEALGAAASLGAKSLSGTGKSTVQAEMEALKKESHTHTNSNVLANTAVALTAALAGAYDRLVNLFTGITSVVTTLGTDNTTIPTSKAVSDAITQSGGLPTGGAAGYALAKNSADNYDVVWVPLNYAEASHNHDGRYYTIVQLTELLAAKAPSYIVSTEDLEPGVSALETGKLYFVYE